MNRRKILNRACVWRGKGIGAVVSLGGGAVIDAGKAIAALVPASGPVIDYLEVVGNGRLLEASAAVRRHPHHRRYRGGSHKNAVINVPQQQRKSACATTGCCRTWRLSTRR
jgi:hypothetical protein